MRLKKIKIKNFKGISLLEFEPKKINLIIGKNNTGKTSVLEAVDLLFNSDEIDQKYLKYIPDIIRVGSKYSEITGEAENTKDSKINLKISKANEIEAIDNFKKDLLDLLITFFKRRMRNKKEFKEEKIEFTEEIKRELLSKADEWMTPELRGNILKGSIIIVKNENKTIKYQLEAYPSTKGSGSDLEILSEHLYKYLKDKFKFGSETSDKFDEEDEELLYKIEILSMMNRIRFYDIKEHKKKIAILIKDLLRTKIEREGMTPETKKRIFDIESIIKEYNLIENLERLDFDYVAFKDESETKFIPFSFFGDGFKAIVYLLWYLSSTNIKNKIVLLDEPEAHMHPGYIHELVKILIKFSGELNIQFFISTHSRDFIEALFSESFSPEEQKYLEKELSVLRMEKIDNYNTSEYLDYSEAKYTINELLLDLRGI